MLIRQTSRDAYESVNRGNIPLKQEIIKLFLFQDHWPDWTCDELEVELQAKHQSVSASIRGLVKQGILFDTGMKRPTRSNRKAIVWRRTSMCINGMEA